MSATSSRLIVALLLGFAALPVSTNCSIAQSIPANVPQEGAYRESRPADRPPVFVQQGAARQTIDQRSTTGNPGRSTNAARYSAARRVAGEEVQFDGQGTSRVILDDAGAHFVSPDQNHLFAGDAATCGPSDMLGGEGALREGSDPANVVKGGVFFLRPFTTHSSDFDLHNIAPQSSAALDALQVDNPFNNFNLAASLTGDIKPAAGNNGGATVSGLGIILQGDLNRSLVSNGATTSVAESAKITLISVNVEGFVEFPPKELEYGLPRTRDGRLAGLSRGQAVEPGKNRITVGAKVLTVTQVVTGTIVDPPVGTTTFSASQGNNALVGVTASWQPFCPFYDVRHDPGGFALIGMARGSLVVGPNKREGNIVFTPAGGAAGAPVSFTDIKTEWIPIGEFELGIQYRAPGAYRNEPTPLKAFKISAVFQVYGNIGVVSANAPSQFSNTDLFLAGGFVQADF
jgi:hypothetical protein